MSDMGILAIGFDFIGTIAHVNADVETCRRDMYTELVRSGIQVREEVFHRTYTQVMMELRKKRLETMQEISNALWLTETLERVGRHYEPDNPVIIGAVDAFFKSYLESITMYDETPITLADLKGRYKLGLISNFTYAKVVRQALDRLQLSKTFDSIVISDEVGWRKPHPIVFRRLLSDLHVKPEECLFVGDDAKYDVVGAKAVGMKTALLIEGPTPSEDVYYDVEIGGAQVEPDFYIRSIAELPTLLGEQR
jgi:putative hydrolase of the HAD superfamily